jgi:hypothetical protein
MATWHLNVHLLKVLQKSGDELLFTVRIFSEGPEGVKWELGLIYF